MDIQNVIFDGSGVITDERPHVTCKKWSIRFGIPEEKLFEVIFDKNYDLAYIGKLTSREYFEKSVHELGMNIPYEQFAKEYVGDCLARPEMLKLVKKLKNRYSLYLLSNQTPINTDYLHPLLDPLFKKIFFSNEVKMHKPSLDIYELLIKETEIDPSQSLFIDDRKSNLLPASKFGIHTLLFTDYHSMLEKLRSFGIQ